jgi:hypothetical protein
MSNQVDVKAQISVLKKLNQARVELQNTNIKKSGQNKFAGYSYFELADFLPAIQTIFNKLGLCEVISFSKEEAVMHIFCTETGGYVTTTSPMASANLKGCHEIQNLGAIETYQRRYLYTSALSVCEFDQLDASQPIVAPKEPPAAATVNKVVLAETQTAPDLEKQQKTADSWMGRISDVSQIADLDTALKMVDKTFPSADLNKKIKEAIEARRSELSLKTEIF